MLLFQSVSQSNDEHGDNDTPDIERPLMSIAALLDLEALWLEH